jgi:hypothetical protein
MNTDKNEPYERGSRGNRLMAARVEKTSQARRSVVKAAAVAPVILTLRSGAAAALTSAESCAVRDQQIAQEAAQLDQSVVDPASSAPEDSLALATQNDGWLRSPVIVRNIRRVRKKKGKFIFKGKPGAAVKVYAHQPKGRFSWWSFRNKKQTKRWNYRDSGQMIDIYDPTGTYVLLHGGVLMFRGPTKKIRYVGIPEQDVEQYGLVALDEAGSILRDEEGMPVIGTALEGGALQSNHMTQSCWLSLHPDMVT